MNKFEKMIHTDEVHFILIERYCKKIYLEHYTDRKGTQPELIASLVKWYIGLDYEKLKERIEHELYSRKHNISKPKVIHSK